MMKNFSRKRTILPYDRIKQGNKWWEKINRRHFKPISLDYVENMKEFTTSEDFLSLSLPSMHLLPYYQSVIYAEEPYIFGDSSLRVVYRR